MTVEQVQCLLRFLGYYYGNIDGIKGPQTQLAIDDFTRQNNLKGTNTKQWELMLLEAVNQNNIKQNINKEKADSFWDEITYFDKKEFKCPCSMCGGFPVNPSKQLVVSLEDIRKHFGMPLYISSGVRCKNHNREVGGVWNSYHLSGRAADFSIEGFTADQIIEYLDTIPHNYFYKIDKYYVHFDI